MFLLVVCLCGLQWLCLLTNTKRKSKSNIVCLCGLQWLCLLSVGDLKVHVSAGGMSLRTAMVVSCYEHKRKSKSNIVCLCGLQWLCLLSVGDLKVNVWKGRMSLWIAMIVFVKCRRSESKCFLLVVCLCGLQWLCLRVFADCNDAALLASQEEKVALEAMHGKLLSIMISRKKYICKYSHIQIDIESYTVHWKDVGLRTWRQDANSMMVSGFRNDTGFLHAKKMRWET